MDEFTKQELDMIHNLYIEDIQQNFGKPEDDIEWEDMQKSNCSLSTKSIFGLKELIKNIPNGETRPQQIILVNKLGEILTENNNGMLQAGTGVGKSIGYLLPTILKGKRFFVSTATKQLTSQLTNKDLPLLQKYLFPDLKFAALQSFSNYICPKKLQEITDEYNLNKLIFDDRKDELAALGELNIKYTNYKLGKLKTEDVTTEGINHNCESFTCSGSNCVRNCKFKDKEECPVNKLVKKAKSADVIVTNHAYVSQLITKASRDKTKSLGMLDKRSLWICDEAHDLDGYLERAFSTSLSLDTINNYMRKLEKYSEIDTKSSISANFDDKYRQYLTIIEEVFDGVPEDDNLFYQDGSEIIYDLKTIIGILKSLFGVWSNVRTQLQMKLYTSNEANNKHDKSIEEEISFDENDLTVFDSSVKTLEEISLRLSTLDALNLRYIPTIKNIVADLMESLLTYNRSNILPNEYVLYSRYDEFENSYNFVISATYLNTGDALQAGLGYLDLDKSNLLTVNSNKVNLVCVSATLCIDGGFRDTADKFGMLKLKDIHCLCEDVGTVFDYKNQGLMYIPTGIPDVKRNRKEHFEFFKTNVRDLIEISHGGALILCTTKSETEETYKYLQDTIGNKYTILSAEDRQWGTKNELVEVFRKDKDSVLVGTRGFFQGLDIQGDSLRLLCLNKLPFGSPRSG